MPKIIRILRSCSIKIFSTFPTINISKLNFWLVICIAQKFNWTTLKAIFSIFRFFCSLRFQIYKYCPNHTSMESYIQRSDDVYISISKNVPVWLFFCAPGSHTELNYYHMHIPWYFTEYHIITTVRVQKPSWYRERPHNVLSKWLLK